jgi:hypothetical protein
LSAHQGTPSRAAQLSHRGTDGWARLVIRCAGVTHSHRAPALADVWTSASVLGPIVSLLDTIPCAPVPVTCGPDITTVSSAVVGAWMAYQSPRPPRAKADRGSCGNYPTGCYWDKMEGETPHLHLSSSLLPSDERATERVAGIKCRRSGGVSIQLWLSSWRCPGPSPDTGWCDRGRAARDSRPASPQLLADDFGQLRIRLTP